MKNKKSHFIKIILNLLASVFFLHAFYIRYWEHRECIMAAYSSCFTENSGPLTIAGAFWLIPSVVFFLILIFQLRKFKK